jgi:twitching motility protein PilI
MATEYLDLQLRQQLRIGLPALAITEVLQLKPGQICPMPEVHPLILGVTNWRGKLLWSLNLSDLLSLRLESASPNSDDALTAVVLSDSTAERTVACVVSKLLGIVEVSENQIQPLPAQFPPAIRHRFRGVARLGSPLLLLDPDRIFQIQ